MSASAAIWGSNCLQYLGFKSRHLGMAGVAIDDVCPAEGAENDQATVGVLCCGVHISRLEMPGSKVARNCKMSLPNL
jgi:hypothetical protein